MRRAAALLAVAVLAGAAAPAPSPPPRLMDWDALFARQMPRPDARAAYGAAPEQVAELWRPAGRGPFPVVLMIHGGCWRSDIAKLSVMNYAADDLRRRGVAVWNVEYRGIDRPGGGYPGTYADVAAAAQALAREARARNLDLRRLTYVGHSAGGHLALWLAASPRIGSGPLANLAPPKPRAVFSLGGLADLSTAAEGCGARAVAAIRGPASAERPDPLADTSPPALLPLGVRQTLVNGAADDTASPALAAAYATKARAAGDRAETIVIPSEGHVEEIAPGSSAWDLAARLIVRAVTTPR